MALREGCPAPSVSFCAAAAWLGRSGQTAELGLTVFDGTSWAAPTAEASFSRPAPACPMPRCRVRARHSVWPHRGDGVYVRWNGSAWSAPAGLSTGPASGRSALSCASPTLCLLADGSQNGSAVLLARLTCPGWLPPTDNANQQAESSAPTGRSAVCASSSASRRELFSTTYLYPSGTVHLYHLKGAYGNGYQCQRGPLAPVPPHSAGQ